MEEIDRKKIKKYFIGKSQLLPVLLILVGIVMFAGKLAIGALLILGGIGWFIYNKFSADLSGQGEVDKAVHYEMEEAKKRAFQKLNVVGEQVNLVEPVTLYGRGFEPESPTNTAGKSFLRKLFKRIILMRTDDPIAMMRFGADGVLRHSLVKFTVFMFGESQLYIYYANVDLGTGLVYSEGTHEMFYEDINNISFSQDREKVYNYRKRKYVRVLFEQVQVHLSGCNYSTYMSTDLDKSIVESQFTGMRNLIRDKKNAN